MEYSMVKMSGNEIKREKTSRLLNIWYSSRFTVELSMTKTSENKIKEKSIIVINNPFCEVLH